MLWAGICICGRRLNREDGRYSFSNNLSENSICPVTRDRKNRLFSDTPEGVQVNTLYLTIEMSDDDTCVPDFWHEIQNSHLGYAPKLSVYISSTLLKRRIEYAIFDAR